MSGGKDSVYAAYIAMNYGWEITHLISIIPEKLSWMYHRENIELMPSIAEAMRIPLLIKKSRAEKEEELEDLKEVIEEAKVEAVVSGAIASEYQRTRIEKICHEIGVKSFTPLWHKRQEELLREMLHAGFKIMITAVAAEGMDEEWLGRVIDEKCLDDLLCLQKKYGMNVAGEGGEYETLVLDCPLYGKRIEVTKARKTWDGSRGSYEIEEYELVEKLNTCES